MGWSALAVALTAAISDLTKMLERGRVAVANDTATALASLTFPFIGGAVTGLLGLFTLSIFGVAISVLAAVLLLVKEPSLGTYSPKVG